MGLNAALAPLYLGVKKYADYLRIFLGGIHQLINGYVKKDADILDLFHP